MFPIFYGGLVETPSAANPKTGNPTVPEQTIDGGRMDP
jgi:hypothetical protein